VHTRGCPHAEYLNDPPAWPLGLVHPKRFERRRQADRRDQLAEAMASWSGCDEIRLDPWTAGRAGVRGGRSPERGGPC
jgi:hypothetical protein